MTRWQGPAGYWITDDTARIDVAYVPVDEQGLVVGAQPLPGVEFPVAWLRWQ